MPSLERCSRFRRVSSVVNHTLPVVPGSGLLAAALAHLQASKDNVVRRQIANLVKGPSVPVR